jgi:hypothetical protein
MLARPDTARARARHGPEGIGPAWPVGPPGRVEVVLRAWPLAQAWPLGLIFGPGWPDKHGVSSRPG